MDNNKIVVGNVEITSDGIVLICGEPYCDLWRVKQFIGGTWSTIESEMYIRTFLRFGEEVAKNFLDALRKWLESL